MFWRVIALIFSSFKNKTNVFLRHLKMYVITSAPQRLVSGYY